MKHHLGISKLMKNFFNLDLKGGPKKVDISQKISKGLQFLQIYYQNDLIGIFSKISFF